ncbi:hypothetical protein BC833DRAFT_622110 [Globomyces pollinis-pini]|nr:hypothetical protein BC833DRAFT_622110 [Globomyces pollinis-pini]
MTILYIEDRIGFETYQDVLKSGVNVVAGKLQAAFLDKKPYVQIIPLKVQDFGKENEEEEAIPDNF